MDDANFKFSEGDGDNFPNESNWNENQWRKYLKESEEDISQFLSIYNSLKDKPDHLNQVAIQMGWNAEDISLTDESEFLDTQETYPGSPEEMDMVPYTLLSHPVIVVTHALYRYLHQSWEEYMNHYCNYISPQLCWQYANSLHQAEMNVLLSVQAIDLGDFGLTICHLKNSLSALNQTLKLLGQVTHPDPKVLNDFRRETQIRLFDLRELWIRVMSDCRIESDRRPDDDTE